MSNSPPPASPTLPEPDYVLSPQEENEIRSLLRTKNIPRYEQGVTRMLTDNHKIALLRVDHLLKKDPSKTALLRAFRKEYGVFNDSLRRWTKEFGKQQHPLIETETSPDVQFTLHDITDRLRSAAEVLLQHQKENSSAEPTETSDRIIEPRKQHVQRNGQSAEFYYASAQMEALWMEINMLAQKDMSVLIEAERGTGKELIAQSLHALSEKRRHEPCIAINCAAIPETLLESALFGHKKGAFTGAYQNQDGYLKTAGRGTLFLDEIGDMPLALQGKLLRVMEGGAYRPLGDTNGELFSDCRIIAATNTKLVERCEAGCFRADLLDRFDYPVSIPPLRDRVDKELLAKYFLLSMRPALALTQAATDKLRTYSFPGNVRELQNILRNAHLVASQKGRDCIDAEHLEKFMRYRD